MDNLQAYRPSASIGERTQIRTISDTEEVQTILSALEDEFCRNLLEVMTEEYHTAQQYSEDCDMPISTTYRKLNTLEEVGLVDTSIKLRKSGHHTKEFALGFGSIMIELSDPDGTVLKIEERSDVR